jgi:hypothetical protein
LPFTSQLSSTQCANDPGSDIPTTPFSGPLAGYQETRFKADAVPRNTLVSTAQPDKKKACAEKTSNSWTCSGTSAPSSEFRTITPCAPFVSWFLASSRSRGMILIIGNRSGCLGAFLTARFLDRQCGLVSYRLRLGLAPPYRMTTWSKGVAVPDYVRHYDARLEGAPWHSSNR